MKWIKSFFSLLRKSKIMKFFEINFLSFFAWFIIQIISRTLRIYQVNFEYVKKFNKLTSNFCLFENKYFECFWNAKENPKNFFEK